MNPAQDLRADSAYAQENLSIDDMGMTPEEREVWDLLTEAIMGIRRLGLNCNDEQWMIGTHLLQQFFQQRVLRRTFGAGWSSWFDDQEVPDLPDLNSLCERCLGTGRTLIRSGRHPEYETCEHCDGSGIRPDWTGSA